MRAEWIWTDHRLAADPRMIYFKKEVRLPDQEMPLACRLRICADSRYLLTINGRRVMTGPAARPEAFDIRTSWTLPHISGRVKMKYL